MSFFVCGDQAVVAYSMLGLTRLSYARDGWMECSTQKPQSQCKRKTASIVADPIQLNHAPHSANNTQSARKNKHFAHVCLSMPGQITQPRQQYNSQRRRSRPNNDQMHEIDCENHEDIEGPEDLMQNFVIESVEIPNSQNEIHITANILNSPLELKVDSGAKCNVISIETLKALRIPFEIDSTKKVNHISYSNNTITTLSTCHLNCSISGQNTILKFNIVKSRVKSILGLPDALSLNLLQLHRISIPMSMS